MFVVVVVVVVVIADIMLEQEAVEITRVYNIMQYHKRKACAALLCYEKNLMSSFITP